MAKVNVMCIDATCRFEVAVMFFVFLSWVYTIIITIGIAPFSSIGLIWMLLFLVSIYFVFQTRQKLKQYQKKMCK